MKKSDLKYGNVVELRNGDKLLLVQNIGLNEYKLIDLKGYGYTILDIYCDDLTNLEGFKNLDIMKVYKDYTCKELLWERKEKPKIKLTEDEKAILRNVPQYYKWIARDGSGVVCLYPDKPHKSKTIWDRYGVLFPFHHLFKFITWEDDEPYLIEELLGGEEK